MKPKSAAKKQTSQPVTPSPLSPSQLQSRQNQLMVVDVRGILEWDISQGQRE
jgi:hypothetical protein